jgi:dihydrodipicolinate synthase/N-acetylneuraminate lyase
MQPTSVQNYDQLEAAIQQKRRPTFTYTVPVETGSEVEKLRIVELETHEEVMAAKRAGADPIILGYELAKESLRGVQYRGGQMQKVSTGDGTADAAFARLDSKARTLLTTAYQQIHSPKKAEGEAFLDSCVVDA